MNKIKQQLIDLKNNMPKRLQWLLLAAAFIVVLILLTLIFSDDKKSDISPDSKVAAKLIIDPDMIDWTNVMVGQKRTEAIKISANKPVKILEVRQHKDVKGFDIKSTCKQQGTIDTTIGCVITATFEPTSALDVTHVPIFIDWYAADESPSMTRDAKIVLSLSANSPVTEKPEPVVVEPKPEPKPEPVPEPIPEPIPYEKDIIDDINKIAPPIDFGDDDPYVSAPEACSDFAFPGYDNSGRQIGWIKPEGGAYKFHPFSDTECDDPTGIYNPDNGIITDINNPGKRIGTDAEHIGFAAISGGELPELSNAPAVRQVNRAVQRDTPSNSGGAGRLTENGFDNEAFKKKNPAPKPVVTYGTSGDNSAVVASQPYDRSFVLRQYKPIPATIVSEIRADADLFEKGKPLPVRATVDRNVFSDDGRNIIIPTGTLMLGYVTGDLPGPYRAVGRMQINWYQFIRPDGVEFNFTDKNSQPFAGDAQGRVGVPGRGSTDYMEQFFMPMLTAMVPAAVNLIAPISDAFVNQIDLDNNTVVQSGTMRSSEMAKNEIITAWNQVAQKLMVDMMDNTLPPFTIAAGTRITVYSPEDLIVVCPDTDKKCYVKTYYDNSMEQKRFNYNSVQNFEVDRTGTDWIGQVRSFNIGQYCENRNGKMTASENCKIESCGGYDYRTILMYCESMNYKSKTEVKQQAYHESEQKKYQDTYGAPGEEKTEEQQAAYDEMIGITYDENGYVENPFESAASEPAPEEAVLTCMDGSMPDANGCCAGEIYTDMGEMGFNCCPEGGGDCFPPIL